MNSLPADVLWGLFVTLSFLPTWGRNECVTNKPHRVSEGRLVINGYKVKWILDVDYLVLKVYMHQCKFIP